MVLCNSHKICFAQTKQTEVKKSLKSKTPQTQTERFRSCQASPGVVETTASAAWQESKSPSDTSIKSDGGVCVRSHPFVCKCVTFQKKPDLNASVLNVFPVRAVKGEATSAANRNNYRNNAPHWEPTSHLSATRWRIITEFVSHTSVDQCLCAVWLNSKTCIHLFNNVLHTSYIRHRRMFTACSDNGLLVSSNVHARPHQLNRK